MTPTSRRRKVDAGAPDEPPALPLWLGTADAARYLGLTTRTVYRLIDEGEVVAYKFGRVIRIKRADLDDFIGRSKIEPGDLAHLYPAAAEDEEKDDESL